MVKVLFVCLGNICRSPMAEAIFINKIERAGLLKSFEVDSCGTGNYHIGQQPDRRTIKVVNKNKVDISHTCRQLITTDLEYFDYLMAMDKSNYFNILRLSTSHHSNTKVKLMREFDPQFPNTEVPDPYYGGDKEFQEVFDILNRSTDNFLLHLRKTHSI